VVWDVTFADSGYSFGDGAQWSRPTSLEVPFVGRPVTLVPSRGGDVHAFWLDDEGSLFYNMVPANSLSSTASWFGGRRLASSVAAFAVAVDDQNRPHLGIIRAEDTPSLPSGVYYMVSPSGGQFWSPPHLLYESNYYQSYLPTSGPADPAGATLDGPAIHVAAETDESTTRLYLSWDNPALKRAFQAVSLDAGSSWSEVEEIDGPSSAEPYESPGEPQVFALGRSVVRTWELRSPGGSCRTRSQASTDAGQTWSEVQPPFAALSGCPEGLQSFRLDGDRRLFLFQQGGQVYLSAWDGSRWTAAQPQPVLGSLSPGDVRFCSTGLPASRGSCGNLARGRMRYRVRLRYLGDREAVGRCRHLVCGRPELDPTADVEDGQTPHSLAAVGDPDGRTHIMWLEPPPDSDDDAQTDIPYVGLEAEGSFGPFLILPGEPGNLDELDLALSEEGRLVAVWDDRLSGDIGLTWTVANQADATASWFDPTTVPGTASASRSPSVVSGDAGHVDVLYAVPVNEERGVYHVASDDSGRTWGQPAQVYQGTTGECEMIGDSQLARSPDGRLHAVWTCGTQPGGRGPLALLYAHSDDSGATWSPAVTLADAPASWSALLAPANGQLHLLWEERRSDRTLTFHRRSLDGGATWSTTAALSSSGGEDGPTSAVADGGGQLHLLQVVQEAAEPVRVRYNRWDGSRWQAGPHLDLTAEEVSQVVDLATAYTDGRLEAIVAERARPNAQGTRPFEIVLAGIEAPAPGPETVGTPESPRPTPTATVAPSAEATATPEPPAFSGEAPGTGSGGLAAGLLAAMVSTVILLGVALAYRFRRSATEATEPPSSDQDE
jgi:hypothetical protein